MSNEEWNNMPVEQRFLFKDMFETEVQHIKHENTTISNQHWRYARYACAYSVVAFSTSISFAIIWLSIFKWA